MTMISFIFMSVMLAISSSIILLVGLIALFVGIINPMLSGIILIFLLLLITASPIIMCKVK